MKQITNNLIKWSILKDRGRSFPYLFSQTGVRTVAIYALTEAAVALYEELSASGIVVKCYIDIAPPTMHQHGVPVLKLADIEYLRQC